MKRYFNSARAGSIATGLLFFPLYLQAQARVEMDTVTGASGSAVFAKIALSLICIVGAILLCAWLAKRAGLIRFTGTSKFRVIASLPLGTREKALLVQVGNGYLLLGVTTQQISLLKSYAEGDNPLQDLVEENAIPDSDSFANQLKKILSQGLPK